MREILFRGKLLRTGKWIEGYYCKTSDTTYAFSEDYDRYPVPEHYYILVDEMTDWGLPNRPTLHEVDPVTIGQYTGLTDKNGKKIFEGDIVEGFDFRADDDGYGVVTWDDGGFLVSNAFLCGSFVENYNGRDFEVIGNIHDNYEFLEGE